MLSPEEIERIKDEELLRLQLRKELSPEKRLLETLSTPFVLWFLGSVVLSVITWSWNSYADKRIHAQQQQEEKIARQREDSQFLGNMLPYLTHADLNVRLRTVDVVKARYPENEIPPAIQQLIANTVLEGNAVPSSQQGAETKHLLARATGVLDRLPSQDSSVASALRELPTRVYLQIFDETQRDDARRLQTSLTQQGFLVPGIENVGKFVILTILIRLLRNEYKRC